MANRFLQWLEKRGSCRVIVRDGQDYLERFFLYRGPILSIYLHRVWASDADDLHDHPWWNMSLILKGGYLEHFLDGTFLKRVKGDFIFRDPRSLHRLELIEGEEPGTTWTLFVTWKRKRDWGFLAEDGWVNAGSYSKQSVEVHGRDYEFKGRLFPRLVILWENDGDGASGN